MKYFLVEEASDGVSAKAEAPNEYADLDDAKARAKHLSAQGKKIRVLARVMMGNGVSEHEHPTEVWRTPDVAWHPRTRPQP